jgi:tetratricopeptide (TPR) repeat protein
VKWWRDKADLLTAKRRWQVAAMGGLLLAVTAWACGPNFPRWLLSNSDESVLAVPTASFFREIAAWKQGAKSELKTVPPKEAQSHADQTLEAEMMELSQSLQQGGATLAQRAEILASYRRAREKLKAYAVKLEEWQADPFDWQTSTQKPKPSFAGTAVPAGLPGEFSDYLKGAVAYYSGETNTAHAAWTGLSQRPAAERHYRSVWAEYMLGRMLVESAPEQAVGHFQKVRELVKAGFADSTGLAAASLGWEARAWFLQKNHKRAIELYSEQISAGDKYYAVVSLRRTVQAAFGQSDAAVKALTEDAQCRRVVTAALISQNTWSSPLIDPQLGDAAEIWLGLLEKNGAVEMELTEQLALAAYQAGKFEVAGRWLKRAPKDSAIVRWLQAKLLLRAGKIDEAAKVLASLARQFPPVDEADDAGVAATLLDRLQVSDPIDSYDPKPARREITGELGVVQLQRKDFVTSLDCLLRGGFWMDAAYVAERVLTTDELKRYVDKDWPKPPPVANPEEHANEFSTASQIRSLLARRLAREERWADAYPYYGKEEAAFHKERVRWLTIGRDAKRPAKERAKALWEAAKITRKQGLELIGTEVEPDWAIHGGSFEAGVTVEERWQQKKNELLKTTTEELKRASQNTVIPEQRWHYRYQAADLGWQAAQLMPDQSVETAKVLYEAGGWLKNIDPKAANRFYRALAMRCNKTELGSMAEKLRWFPPLDENGKPFMPKRVPKEKAVAPVNPVNPPAESFPVF